MLDVNSGEYVRDAVILIQNGKIADVGRGLMIPTGAKVIDVGTATLLPGLIDVHTHLMARIREGNQVENYTLQLATKSGAYRALEGAADAHLTLQAGFTTVRDVESEGSGYRCRSTHGHRAGADRRAAYAGRHAGNRRHQRLLPGTPLARPERFSNRCASEMFDLSSRAQIGPVKRKITGQSV